MTALLGLLAFSCAQFPGTVIKKPHPLFWRLVLGLMTFYSLLLIYLFLQPLNDARGLLKLFDENFGVPLDEKNYALDCAVYTPSNPRGNFANIKDAVLDIYFVAHFFGWWIKMMIMRDVTLCWIGSVTFEIIEITFQHWIPNFWECWWDHVRL